jgi:hypothetical protein
MDLLILGNRENVMEQIKKYPAYLQAVDEILKSYTYGDIIPKVWLAKELELIEPETGTYKSMQEYQFKFLAAIEPLKEKLLTDHQMYLKSVRGEGYLIVAPEQQTDVVWGYLKKKLGKELGRAATGLQCLNVAALSEGSKRTNIDCQVKLAALRAHNVKQLEV